MQRQNSNTFVLLLPRPLIILWIGHCNYSYVFILDVYISPTNAYFEGSDMKFLSKDDSNPTKFHPQLDSYYAANWFDLDTNLLYIVIKGSEPVDIITTPVIQVGVNVYRDRLTSGRRRLTLNRRYPTSVC